jgi:hypothetical protein
MVTPIGTGAERLDPLGLRPRALLPNFYDIVVFFMIAGAFVALAHGAREMEGPLANLDLAPVTLDPRNLPGYALLTTLRMFAAIVASLLFTFVVATLAAKSRKAELVIIPNSAPSVRLSSRSSPPKPGIWPSAFINRCERCRVISTR